jgi:hypothetical protein
VAAAFDRVRRATDHVIREANEDPELPGAVSTDYLDLVGYALYAWFWGRMGTIAADDEFGRAKVECARFYFARLLPRTSGLLESVLSSSESVMGMPEDAF